MQICSRRGGWALPMLVFGLCSPVRAQTVPATPLPPREQPLGIYVDCKNITCDLEFLRTEISFVTHLRDRRDADVHVLIASQPTAAGGTETTLTFIGLKMFQGQDDSLRYIAGPTATADELRRRLADALKRGLVRYVNHTSVAESLTIVYTPPPASTAVPLPDRWNYWTF